MEDLNKSCPEMNHQKEEGPSQSESNITEMENECLPENRFVDITAMIRSLQRSEGANDCFRRGIGDCDQVDCNWRQYCLNIKE